MEEENSKPAAAPKAPKPASQRFPGILLRLVLVLVAGCLVGAVVYFGAAGWIPYFDQRIFQPIDQSQAEIRRLSTSQAEFEAQLESLQGTLTALEEDPNDAIQEILDQINIELDALQSSVDTNTYYAATLNPGLVATVTDQLRNTNQNLSAIATAQMADAGIRQDLTMLRVLDLFSQANTNILHNNYGLAEEQLELSTEILSGLGAQVPPSQRVTVLEMIGLLEGCLNDLPARPSLAAEKLTLAWQMGLVEFPNEDPRFIGTITPTPYDLPELTPTPTPN